MEGALRVARPLRNAATRLRIVHGNAQLYSISFRVGSRRRGVPLRRAPGPVNAEGMSCRSNMTGVVQERCCASGIIDTEDEPIELQLLWGVGQRHLMRRQILGEPALPASTTRESFYTFHSFSDGSCYHQRHFIRPRQPEVLDWNILPAEFRDNFKTPAEIAEAEIYKSASTTAEPTLALDQLSPELQAVFESNHQTNSTPQAERESAGDSEPGSPAVLTPSKKFLKKQQRIAQNKEIRRVSRDLQKQAQAGNSPDGPSAAPVMTSKPPPDSTPAQHKPLVVGRTKPQANPPSAMADTDTPETKSDPKHEVEKDLQPDTIATAPAGEAANPPAKKKEKAPKQPKPPKAAPPTAPLSPALLDLRVGHILRAINHPNADSLYVSTIAMGDPEGTEHTQVDEETGKVVRTVCSGLNGLVPLAEMQDRKVVVVANLKPVNMRSIKSAAMVLAASPPAEEGADPHAADRVVELVMPPEAAEAGDPVFFEGWEYGEGKGPEKQLNPKKKQWEAIQPGFYTTDDLVVGFNAGNSEVEGDTKGDLVVKAKGKCTVKTLKGAVVR